MNSFIRVLLFSQITTFIGLSQPCIISTIAGTDRLLDGNPAISVPLRDPRAVKVDGAGAIYIVDTADNRIRKINSSGIISTIVGGGFPGFSGDRGKAKDAEVKSPTSLALDGNGNLYFVDRDNFRVRRISPDGTINTIAGVGTPGYSGDNGPAVSAQMYPYAVAADAKGNLYIADLTFRIRKIDGTGVITTIAGTGTRGYSGDNGPAAQATIDAVVDVAVGPDGSIYLVDAGNFRVRKIDPSGMMTLVAGNGEFGFINENIPARLALMEPQGVAVDTFGNVYISDFNRDQVRKVDVGSGLIHTIAGDGTGTPGFGGDNDLASHAQLNSPFGLAIGSTGLYIADQYNARIRRVNNDIITTVAGTGIRDGGPATSAFLGIPKGIAVDGANNIVVADPGNGVVRRFTPGGNINTFGQVQAAPTGVATDQAGNFYVTDDEPRILKITPAGVTSIVAGNGKIGYSGDGGPATSAMISNPTGVAVDVSGNIYFTDFQNNRIRKVSASTGLISTIAGNGSMIFAGDGGPALSAGMDPYDIAVDSKSNIYVADRFNNRIRKIGSDGMIITVAGTGFPGNSGDGGLATAAMLTFPTGVAIDTAGFLYLADNLNAVVRRITPGGLITTIAGSGVRRPAAGDGGPALAAQLDPWRLAVDVPGNVYVTDSFNDRVRKLTPQVVTAAAMAILAGNNQSGTVSTKLTGPIVVRITDATKAAIPGVIVNFTVSPAGSATVTPPQAITLPDGSATATVTLGNTPGPVTITATTSGVTSVAFTATATSAVSPTAPHISSGGVVGAGLSTPPVAGIVPNAIVSIFGTKFAPDGTARQVGGDDLVGGKLPTNLAGVCTLFGTQRAPIFAVFPGQLNVQVPQVSSGSTTVQVITKCDTPQAETSIAEPVTIQTSAPEFFYFTHNANGRNPIATINALTGGYVGASGLVAGTLFTPAKPGDILSLFATGLGATNPSFAPGELPGVAAQVTAPYSVSIGGVALAPADILYVGVTQNAGLYQVNLRVPDAVPDGDQAVILTVGGVATPAGGFLTVSR
jgi:uncharacterized protein (TIGR03437 family)